MKKLLRLTSIILIQAFLLPDFAFIGRSGDVASSLSPQLAINKAIFQKAYLDYDRFGREITNLPHSRLSKLEQKRHNIYPQRTRILFDEEGRVLRTKDNVPIEQAVGFPGTWLVREETADYAKEKSFQQKEAAKIRLQALISKEFYRRYPGQEVSGEIVIRTDMRGITIASSSDRRFLRVNTGIDVMFEEKVRIQALIAEAFEKISRVKTGPKLEKTGKASPKSKKSYSVLFVDFFDARDDRMKTLAGPSLGNMLLAMSLRKEGMEVSFAKGRTDAENNRIIERIKLEKVDVVAISMVTPYINELKAVQDFVRAVRAVNEDVVIALGGPSVTLAPDLFAQHIPEANVVIAGEAEAVFKRVLVCLAGQKASRDLSFRTVSNLMPLFGTYLRFGKTSFAANLDYLNYFYDLEDAMKEFKIDFGFLNESDVRHGLTLITSRGCPYRCSFCSQIMGPVYRTLSTDSVKAFLTAYKERVSVLYKGRESSAEFDRAMTVWFVDDDMFIRKSRGMQILDIARELGFNCGSLAVSVNSFFRKKGGEKVIDEPLFEALAKVDGLGRLEIGVDGFTDDEIRRLGKGGKLGYSMDDVKRVIELCEKYKIKNTNFFILINADTSWADFWESFFTVYSLAKNYRFFKAWGNNFLEYYVHTPSFRDLISRPDFKDESLTSRISSIDGFPESNLVIPVWYRQNLVRASAQKIGGRFSFLVNDGRFPINLVVNEALVYTLIYNDSDKFGFARGSENRNKVMQFFVSFIDTNIKDVQDYLERMEDSIAFQSELASDHAGAEEKISFLMYSLESLLITREILKIAAGKSFDNKLKREIEKIEKFLTQVSPDIEKMGEIISDYSSTQMMIFFGRKLAQINRIINKEIPAWEYIAERFDLEKEIATHIQACKTNGISLQGARNVFNTAHPGVKKIVDRFLGDSRIPEVMTQDMAASGIKQRLEELENMTGIRDEKLIAELEGLLHSSLEEADKEKVARKIIEEVLGEEYAQVRLEALKIIIPSVICSLKSGRPSEGQMDLHTHTYLSDAYATPTAWVLQAYEQEGLAAMAITDHDTFPGQEASEAMKIINEEIEKQNLLDNGSRPLFRLIPAMEVTTMNNGIEAHVLLYLPGYDIRNVVEEEKVKDILAKIKAGDEKTVERAGNIRNRINEQYPEFYISEEEVRAVIRGPGFYSSAIGDAIWKKYKDKFPDKFKALGINSEKDVWYNLIARKGLHKRSQEHERLLPTLEDVLKLAGALGGKIAIAHPNEIIRQGPGAFENILENIAGYALRENISPSVVLGIAYYSHKLRRSGLRQDVKTYVEWLNEEHPFYKRFNLLFLPESDAHGKFTLPNTPLGLQSDYPEDKSVYNEMVLGRIYADNTPLSAVSGALIRKDYGQWKQKTMLEVKNSLSIDSLNHFILTLDKMEALLEQAI